MSSGPVMVVGAGVGGLTLALALLRQGREVVVYEQAHELAEIGAGVQLSPNATRVLNALGLARALDRCAVEPQEKQLRHWKTGRSWRVFELGAVCKELYGAPYIFIHRADLQAILAAGVRALDPNALLLGARVIAVAQDDAGVGVRLADGRQLHGSLLIGADGVHSLVRTCVFGADRPSFTGCIAWRGVIPRDRLAGGAVPRAGTNWIGPGRHVVHYPLRRGELLNFVGVVERRDWCIESWSAQGTRTECLADFAGWHQDVRALIAAIDTPYKWALMARSAMSRWSTGRVTLLGDACHAALPFLAQGAAMAIEDGYVLARCIAGHAHHRTAYARYEAARVARTARVVSGSADNLGRFHNPRLADDGGAEHYIATEWTESKVADRYAWLFGYDAVAVEL